MYGTQFAQIIPPRALDSDQSHFLHHLAGSDLSANRDLIWVTGDADRQAVLQGDPTLDDWFDQSVKTSGAPTFSGLTLTGLGGVLRASAGSVSGSAGFSDLAAAAADVDMGAFKFTARQLESNVAAGTPPLAVASADVVSNLNADLLDGQHASSFLADIAGESLGDLSDVDTSGASADDFLKYDGAGWIDFDLFAAANTWTAANTFTGSANPLVIGSGAAGVDYQLKFDGENNDGLLVWKEDEDYFSFADDVLMELNLCFALTTYKIHKEPLNTTLAYDVPSGANFKWYINSVQEMKLDADGRLHVDGVFCAGLTIQGDAGADVLGNVVFTNVTAAVGSGSAARLGGTGGKAPGPATAAQWGWRKEYDGMNTTWVPIWR